MMMHRGVVLTLCCLLTATTVQAAEPTSKQVDGYRGIWFTLGQYYGKGKDGQYLPTSSKPVFPYGDKYSGGLGTYTAKHTPLAIYCESVQKTFFVYGGTTGASETHLLCMASYYDHKLNRVPKPTIVYDKQGVNDPHDNPSMAVDAQGYIWVFVSGRARSRMGFKYRSTEPYSVESFERITEEEMTYPQPKYVTGKGFLNLFTKYTGVRELYFERSSDGTAWDADQKLAGIRQPGHSRGGHYQTSAARGDKIGTFFNRHPDGNVDRRTDVYYVQTTDMGDNWTTVDGTPVSLPIEDVDSPTRVIDYASEKLNVYLKDMGFDGDGHPVFLYITSRGHQPGPPNDPRLWRVTRWDGSAWKTTEICPADHNYDMGSLYITEDRWAVIGPTQTGPQPYHGGGEIALWESRDQGQTWVRKKQITDGSSQNHNYARRPLNARDPFFVFWADGDPTRLSPSRLYFADSTGQHVWRLPYTMDEPFAKPERVE